MQALGNPARVATPEQYSLIQIMVIHQYDEAIAIWRDLMSLERLRFSLAIATCSFWELRRVVEASSFVRKTNLASQDCFPGLIPSLASMFSV
jgi:hypothetical protein